MKVGSMFAGIGGFDLGFERAGFEVSWCIEIDRHARSVLARRFPKARLYEDIREVDPDSLESVDVICGGFPCQDLSVAGRRAGLEGERSGLFYDAIRIVRKINPKFLVLENVPGLFSSNRGLDFAAVLREVGDGWDCEEVAWRVLDSQYFGVAQRRRRVFVVASRAVGGAEQVLALSEGCSGDPSESREAREEASREAQGSSPAYGGDVSYPVTSKWHKGSGGPSGDECSNMVLEYKVTGHGEYSEGVGTLRATGGDCGGGSETLVTYRKSRRAQSAQDNETWVEAPVSNTLNTFDVGVRDTHVVVGTLDCNIPKQRVQNMMVGHWIPIPPHVRRLTPTECERLQGFPDNWTAEQADTHRYKQLGNAVTVNVAEWLAKRVVSHMQGV